MKDSAVSVNRIIWSPDGSFFGKLVLCKLTRVESNACLVA